MPSSSAASDTDDRSQAGKSWTGQTVKEDEDNSDSEERARRAKDRKTKEAASMRKPGKRAATVADNDETSGGSRKPGKRAATAADNDETSGGSSTEERAKRTTERRVKEAASKRKPGKRAATAADNDETFDNTNISTLTPSLSGIRTTRSGRRTCSPLKYWIGHRFQYEPGQVINDTILPGGIKGLVKKEPSPPPRPAPQRATRKRLRTAK